MRYVFVTQWTIHYTRCFLPHVLVVDEVVANTLLANDTIRSARDLHLDMTAEMKVIVAASHTRGTFNADYNEYRFLIPNLPWRLGFHGIL